MAAHYPSATSVFIKDHAASNKMVVDFARNIRDFGVNRYTQIVKPGKVAGYYQRMTIEEAGRIRYTNLRDFVWHDGQPAPEGNENVESFEFFPFECKRYIYPFTLGDLTVSQASWDIMAQHASIRSRQGMTARTQLAISQLTDTTKYAASHLLDVTTIAGNTGNWANSTTARQDIKRSLITAAELILDDTLGAVKPEDLMTVINSALAGDMSMCQEVVDYIKGSPEALAQVRGELPGKNVMYGLPDRLYGFPIEVESTRKVTSKKGATRATSQILAKATPFMCARPGSLEGIAGSPNFSTCVGFAFEEMTVETMRDANNRRSTGRVVENIVYEMTAPASGVLFSAAA